MQTPPPPIPAPQPPPAAPPGTAGPPVWATPPPSYSVLARSQHVVDVHQNPEHPARPLSYLIPGALLAIAALAVGGLVAYATFSQQSLDQTAGIAILVAMFVVYVAGVFLFAYGYEVYNVRKAIKLTAIVVVVTVGAVFIVAVLAVVLGAMSQGGGSRSSGRSSSSSSSGRGGGGGGSALSYVPFIFIGGPGGRRTVVNNVPTPITCPACHRDFVPVKGAALQCPYCNAVLEAHQKPVVCPYCSQSYVPQDHQFKCPNCGAATPPSLMLEVAPPPPPPGAAPPA